MSSPTVGYPAVVTSAPKTAPDLPALQIEDFEEAASPRSVNGLKGAEFTLITVLGHIVGPYAELKAAEDAEKERKQAAQRAEEEKIAAHRARLHAQQKRLRDLGISSTRASILTGPDVVAITADDLDKLLALIDEEV